MEHTILAVGLASLLASIVGGGLKAFGIEIPLLTTGLRQAALFIFGLVLCFIAVEMQPRQEPEPVQPSQTDQLVIRYARLGGPFVELGEGKRHPQDGYWWHAMDIRIENRCSDPIHIEGGNISLYLARAQSLEDAVTYSSETVIPYSQRLPSGWVEPGSSIEGRLVFEVPDRLPDGSESNGSYHMIRVRTQSQCPAAYDPY